MLNHFFRQGIWGLVFGFYLFFANQIAAECDSDSFLSSFIDCFHGPAPEHIGLSHTEGNGLGYSKGYTSLELFLSQPLCQNQIIPFVDLRGHIFNDGKYATNSGIGLRWLNECAAQVLGVNFFYDSLKTSHRPYHQVSFGLEALNETWDFHLNGYFPVGHKKTHLFAFNYDLTSSGFILVGKEQLAMRGVDFEADYHFCTSEYFDLYVGGGPYYYWGRSAQTENVFRHSHKHAFGGRLRAYASFMSCLSLEAVTSYDHRFKWTGQVTFAINLPFELPLNIWGLGRECAGYEGSCCLKEKLYQPVLRNEIIVVDRIHRHSSNPAILDPEFEPE